MKWFLAFFFIFSFFTPSELSFASDSPSIQSELPGHDHQTPERPFEGGDDSEKEKEKERDDELALAHLIINFSSLVELEFNFQETLYSPPFLENPSRPPRA